MSGFDSPIHTNDQSIERVLAAGLPVLLVFLDGQAPFDLEAELQRAARENAGKVLVVKVQSRENPQSMDRFRVTNTPAAVALRPGESSAASNQAASLNTKEVQKYVDYLLGRGAKPTPTQGYTANGGSGVRQANTGNGKPVHVDEAGFEREVFQANLPVLVDFWAPWCGPCRMTDPILEKFAHEMAGRLKVAKVNVDDNPGIANRYGVRGIPTMLIVKNGKVVDQWTGALPEQMMLSRLAPHVK